MAKQKSKAKIKKRKPSGFTIMRELECIQGPCHHLEFNHKPRWQGGKCMVSGCPCTRFTLESQAVSA